MVFYVQIPINPAVVKSLSFPQLFFNQNLIETYFIQYVQLGIFFSSKAVNLWETNADAFELKNIFLCLQHMPKKIDSTKDALWLSRDGWNSPICSLPM